MRNTLLLRPDSIAEDTWCWLRLGEDGTPQGSIHAGSLVNAAAESGGLRVTVLVPGTECLLSRVEIPGRNRQKLLRAVPFALESTSTRLTVELPLIVRVPLAVTFAARRRIQSVFVSPL